LHVIALAQYTAAYTRGWAVNGRIARVRLKAENDQLRQEVALLTEEIGIKDARMKRIDPQKRTHYMPAERMAFLNSVPHEHGPRSRQPRPSSSRQPRLRPG